MWRLHLEIYTDFGYNDDKKGGGVYVAVQYRAF